MGWQSAETTRGETWRFPASASSLAALFFRNGGRIDATAFSPLDGGNGAVGSEAAVYGPGSELLGIVLVEAEGLKYRVVMPESAA